MDTYVIRWASPRTHGHEHWYRVDETGCVMQCACILNEPEARCVAPMVDVGHDFHPGRYARRLTLSRVPQYARRHRGMDDYSAPVPEAAGAGGDDV
jgi:hypothetical protein